MKNKNKILIPFTFIAFLYSTILIFTGSCKHESSIIGDIDEICFERDIFPVFENSCALSGCHNPQSAESGYIFDSYNNILQAVTPGDASSSKAYLSLIDIWSDEMMPPGEPLSLENRTLIRVWIEQGARNTECPDTGIIINPEDTATWVNPRACFQRDILPIFSSSCAISGCHDAISDEQELLLTNYTQIGANVRPGDPAESEIYQKLVESNPDDIMPPPPYSPLPSAQIDSIYNWILYGALDEYCGLVCDTSVEITFSGVIWPMMQLNCVGCHSGTSPNGNVSLSGYSAVEALITDGRIPGVLTGVSYPLMPPGTGLSNCNLKKFEIWIENGSQNN